MLPSSTAQVSLRTAAALTNALATPVDTRAERTGVQEKAEARPEPVGRPKLTVIAKTSPLREVSGLPCSRVRTLPAGGG